MMNPFGVEENLIDALRVILLVLLLLPWTEARLADNSSKQVRQGCAVARRRLLTLSCCIDDIITKQ